MPFVFELGYTVQKHFIANVETGGVGNINNEIMLMMGDGRLKIVVWYNNTRFFITAESKPADNRCPRRIGLKRTQVNRGKGSTLRNQHGIPVECNNLLLPAGQPGELLFKFGNFTRFKRPRNIEKSSFVARHKPVTAFFVVYNAGCRQVLAKTLLQCLYGLKTPVFIIKRVYVFRS